MRRFLSLLAVVPVLLLGGCGTSDDPTESPEPSDTAAWEDAYEQNEMGKADSSGCSGVVVPDRSGFAKRVALTFDDGPNPETTPQVLDVLAQRGIKATFFINGKRVTSDAARAVLGRIVSEGHILANHSQSHLNLKTVSSQKMQEEVTKTHQVILAAGVTPRYFRFPFGSATCGAIDFVESLGYVVTGWHIDSADWCYASGNGYCSPSTFRYVPDGFRDDMVGYTLSQVKSKNGGILLFHDIHPNTASKIGEIIRRLVDAGFSFVNIDDTSTFPLLNGATPAPTPFIGDPCTSDAECQFSADGKTGSCHRFTPTGGGSEVGFCTLPCEGYCPDKYGKAPTFCTSLDGGATGSCVSKPDASNGNCSKVPGTAATPAARFIGSSAATPTTTQACLPK